MRDLFTSTVEAAGHVERSNTLDSDDAPAPSEYMDDSRLPRMRDPYKGTCGGCRQPVSAYVKDPGGHEGSCLWREGPWHPSCRESDREAGGTSETEAQRRAVA